MAALPAFISYVLAAIAGGWIDATFTMMRDHSDLATLAKNRLHGIATWGKDLGVLAAELPLFAAKLAALAMLLVIAKRLYGRPMKTWMTSATRFRWRHVLIGLIGTGGLMSICLFLWGYFGRSGYQPTLLEGPAVNVVVAALGLFFITALNASGEEIFFRGWLFQQTAAFTGRVSVPLGVGAIAFALAHQQLEPARLIQLFAGGLAFGWAAWRLGGLELAMGAHTGFNLAISAFMPVSYTLASPGELADRGLSAEYMGRVSFQTAFSTVDWVVLALVALIPLLVAEAVARWPKSVGGAVQGVRTRAPVS